jgi:hypothetical protein
MVLIRTPLLNGAERQTLDELVLGHPTDDDNEDGHHERGCGRLGCEQALTGDEADEIDRRGAGLGRGQVEGEEELVPLPSALFGTVAVDS